MIIIASEEVMRNTSCSVPFFAEIMTGHQEIEGITDMMIQIEGIIETIEEIEEEETEEMMIIEEMTDHAAETRTRTDQNMKGKGYVIFIFKNTTYLEGKNLVKYRNIISRDLYCMWVIAEW